MTYAHSLSPSELRYYDTIAIRHKDTRVFLHSHVDRYPLKYEDGRISSQGILISAHNLAPYLHFVKVNKLLVTAMTIPTTTGKSYPPRPYLKLVAAVLSDMKI